MSEIKKYAYETLDCFDELARPEIKNIVFDKIWKFVYNYVHKIIGKKPDSELKQKLEKVHLTLSPLFTKAEISLGIKEGEELGSPQIPNVGELAKIRALTAIDEKKAFELVKELGL